MDDYIIIEEKFMPNKWKVLVCCILLNRTRKVQVEPIIDELFKKYPTAESLSVARIPSIRKIIRPLGLFNRRSIILKRFSKEVVELGISKDTVSLLSGIGQYGKDAYLILFEGSMKCPSRDYALLKYLKHKREHEKLRKFSEPKTVKRTLRQRKK